MSEAQVLLDLQNADFSILRAQKRLDSLPEKERILEIRAKYNEICKKRAQLIDLKDDVDLKVAKLQNEDSMLKDKMAEAQVKLNGTEDYRLTANITKEMEGFAKRREKIDFELDQLLERSDKTDGVKKQIEDVLATLEAQEKATIDSYRKNGHALQSEIADLQVVREKAAAQLSSELLERYEKLRASKGGVAAGELLQGKLCSVCRVEYQEGQLQKLKREGVISTCPNCHRILVISKEAQ